MWWSCGVRPPLWPCPPRCARPLQRHCGGQGGPSQRAARRQSDDGNACVDAATCPCSSLRHLAPLPVDCQTCAESVNKEGAPCGRRLRKPRHSTLLPAPPDFCCPDRSRASTARPTSCAREEDGGEGPVKPAARLGCCKGGMQRHAALRVPLKVRARRLRKAPWLHVQQSGSLPERG